MQQKNRILLVVMILVVIVGVVIGVDTLTRRRIEAQSSGETPAESIPILADGVLVARFVPGDLETLEKVSFVDEEEGKTQEGWMLRDVLLIYLDASQLMPDNEITVSSSSRGKAVSMRWDSIENVDNMVIFDLSGRGTLKLVSKMEGLNIRNDWLQDVDQIEVYNR